MTVDEVKGELVKLLPNHHKLFEVDEHETMAGNGTMEITVRMRFGSGFVKREDIHLDVELSMLIAEFQGFVYLKLREMIDKLNLERESNGQEEKDNK